MTLVTPMNITKKSLTIRTCASEARSSPGDLVVCLRHIAQKLGVKNDQQLVLLPDFDACFLQNCIRLLQYVTMHTHGINGHYAKVPVFVSQLSYALLREPCNQCLLHINITHSSGADIECCSDASICSLHPVELARLCQC